MAIRPSYYKDENGHDYIFGKAEVEFLRGRLKFEINGESKDAAPFPSALITFGRKLGDDE